MTTIKDIARMANVSTSTVSFVLNGRARQMKVSPVTEQRILEIVKELGYKPNSSARKLQANEKDKPVLAVYWPLDRRTSYIGRILNGLRNEITRIGLDYDFTVKTYIENHLCEDKTLLSQNYYNCAIIGALSPVDMEYLSSLKTDLPIILYNRQLAGYHSVFVNYDGAVRKVVEIAKNKGCKSIAFVKNKSNFLAGSARMRHAVKITKELGIRVIEESYLEVEDEYEGGTLAVKNLLKYNSMPELLFCASDQIAVGASFQLQKEGLKIPDDVEIICFGLADRDLTEYSIPSISVIEIPTEEMTAGAVNIAVSMREAPSDERVVREYEPIIKLRDSFNI